MQILPDNQKNALIDKTPSRKILFGSAYSIIEPLGLLYLGGLARDLGFERNYCLVKDFDFDEFHQKVRKFRPDFVGFNVYTGNHLQVYKYYKNLKKEFPGILTILGGPHPSYFPAEAEKHADFVVMSEGFESLKKVLTKNASRGVVPISKNKHTFPFPDREVFYRYYPGHGESPIKSIITMTGCPFRCTYCYNSTNVEHVTEGLSEHVINSIGNSKMRARLFPWNFRSVDDVIKEAKELNEKYPTKMIYFQDDVFGMKMEWLKEFASRWPKEVGLRWHAQMRWEMSVDEQGKKRLELCKKGGCHGLTFAIEAADPVVRREILDRQMAQHVIFDGMKNCKELGLLIRTEQITGLPYGATTKETKINLDADLEILELNVKLRSTTNGPDLAWASTFVPYARTRLGMYSKEYGFYENPGDENWDIKDTFFERSVLRFLKKFVGTGLKDKQNDPSIWLDSGELEKYKDMNAELRNHFNLFAYLFDGHVFARKYLKNGIYTFEALGKMIHNWANNYEKEKEFASHIDELAATKEQREHLVALTPYFSVVPDPVAFAKRFLENGAKKGNTMKVLSDTARHHLYDHVLYEVV